MVKPSLKTTSFKHHPVYIQKSLHVDNPFYGPKPMYQRAEVIPGGDCDAPETYWATDDATWVRTAGTARVGTDSLLMTQTNGSDDGSIYLRLSGPIDLSWAKFIGFWYKTSNAANFSADDIHLYIFTRYGNYAYANAARYVDPFGDLAAQATPAAWHYAEVELGDFAINTGYEGDKLDEVWGIGFCSLALTTAEAMNIDQIEFYTVGTGLGPARGLIESAPLLDGIHAQRSYGLRWDENSGRLDHSDADSGAAEFAFAGICTGNPSRTRLSASVVQTATTIHVVDASLFDKGTARIWDDSNSEDVTVSAVNRITKVLTVSAIAQAIGYTVGRHAKIAMMGDEEGTIRVDFIVDGVVNVTAAEIIQQGYGAKCKGAGDAFTVEEDNAAEEGKTIGKCIGVTCKDAEDFPIKLMTDARTA